MFYSINMAVDFTLSLWLPFQSWLWIVWRPETWARGWRCRRERTGRGKWSPWKIVPSKNPEVNELISVCKSTIKNKIKLVWILKNLTLQEPWSKRVNISKSKIKNPWNKNSQLNFVNRKIFILPRTPKT
jgi:hypothetical protein